MFCKLEEGQNLDSLLVEYRTQGGPTLAVSVMTAYLPRQRTEIEPTRLVLSKEVCYLHHKTTRTELPRLRSPRKSTNCESALCEA